MIRHHEHKDIQEKLLALRRANNGSITQDLDGEESVLDDDNLSLKKLGCILDNTATNLGLWQD